MISLLVLILVVDFNVQIYKNRGGDCFSNRTATNMYWVNLVRLYSRTVLYSSQTLYVYPMHRKLDVSHDIWTKVSIKINDFSAFKGKTNIY
jgi:hypothetical protein